MFKLIKKRLIPFSHANFRYFFFAQSFSLVGTWSHELARSWLVLDIAGTTTALGMLLLTTALPGLFLTLHGGALADRSDARKLVIICKSILAASAFAFFLVSHYVHLELWMILIFGLIEGFVNSFDGPAFTTIFARVIPRQDFQQALAIQSTSFHVARMLGPTVAGLIMAVKGPSYVFLFDAVSYLVVIAMLINLKLRDKEDPGQVTQKKGVREIFSGVKFFFRNPAIRYKQFQFIITMTIILPVANLVFRSFLKQKFSLNAEQFGYLFSFPAMGAMTGALYFTFAALKKPIRNLIVGVPCLVVCLFLVRDVTSPHYAAILLGVCGFFSYLNIASITQSLQLETPDEYRGRLGSLLVLGFNSIGPLMSFPIGIYTDHFGFERSIRDFTIIFAILSAALAYSNFRNTKYGDQN